MISDDADGGSFKMGESASRFQDFKIVSRLFQRIEPEVLSFVDEEILRHPALKGCSNPQEGHWWTPGDNRECPKCGTEQPQTSKFCGECGWRLRILWRIQDIKGLA